MPCVPQAAEQPRPLPARPAAAAFALPPRTLLLVEDSRIAAEAVRLLCRLVGIRLRRAESLAAARLHLRVYRPDIALIDLGLPDGSGLDLIATLDASRMRPQRLVAISGDAGLTDAAMEAGADAFLTKPVSLTQHLAALTGEPTLAFPPEVRVQDWQARGAGTRDRNTGGDPLALRDDLRRVTELLSDAEGPGQRRYAAQFLASVGHSMRDPALAEAAETAARTGDYGTLVKLVRSKSAAMPEI